MDCSTKKYMGNIMAGSIKSIFTASKNGKRWNFLQLLYTHKRYVVCAGSMGYRCYVRARVDEDGTWHIRNPNAHRHPANRYAPEMAQMLHDLFRRRTRSFETSRQIYDQIANNYPHEITRRVTFESVRVRMMFWERNMNLPPVDRYNAAHNLFQREEYMNLQRHGQGRVVLAALTAADGSSALAFGDPSMIQSLPENAVYDLDITFSQRIVPDLHNTNTVMTVSLIYGTYALAIGYGYFNEISPGICHDVCEFFRMQIMANARNQQPLSITTVHDWRIRGAIEAVWPGVQVRGTFHSFCLCILNQANLQPGIELENEEHQTILCKLMNLALLPAEHITAMFLWLKRSIELGPQELQDSFAGFLIWFENSFVIGLRPEFWSVHQSERALSNAPILIVQNLVNKIHPAGADPVHVTPFYQYYANNLSVISDSRRNLDTLLGALELRRRVRITTSPKANKCMVVNERGGIGGLATLRRLWNYFDGNVVTPIRFLSIAANTSMPSYDLLVFQRDYVNMELQPFNLEQIIERNVDAVQIPEPDFFLLLQRLAEREFQRMIRLERAEVQQNIVEEVPDEIDEPAQLPEPPNEQQVQVRVNNPARQWAWRCQGCHNGIARMIARPCNCVCLCEDCIFGFPEGQAVCHNCHQRVLYFERLFLNEIDNADFPVDWTCGICENFAVSFVFGCRHLVCAPCVVILKNRGNDGIRGAALCPFCRALSVPVEANLILLE